MNSETKNTICSAINQLKSLIEDKQKPLQSMKVTYVDYGEDYPSYILLKGECDVAFAKSLSVNMHKEYLHRFYEEHQNYKKYKEWVEKWMEHLKSTLGIPAFTELNQIEKDKV